MRITVSASPEELGREASCHVADKLRMTLKDKGEARLLLSTGASQFFTLASLLDQGIEWERVEIFHLDEYIGLPQEHPASFRKYLNDRFVGKIRCRKFHGIDTERPAAELIPYLTREVRKGIIDVGLIGIGENGHIAFNDPPADFDTRDAFKIVELDMRCRQQQVREGWFKSMDDVPSRAVSMTVWQIMQCSIIISAVPFKVKAEAVARTLSNPLTNLVPATMLKQHSDFNLFLDRDSASGLISF